MSVNNEWELSKENVQPLRRGRRMEDLETAFQSDSCDTRKQLQEFEMRLRSTDSTPEEQLDIWYSYIEWVEEHSLKRDSTTKLLQRCIQHFKDEKELFQNEKFLLVWLKMCDTMDTPELIFDYMLDQDIGTSLALFYKAWAEHFEVFGSPIKAEELYNLGINRKAEPVELLEECLREFTLRMSKMKLQNNDDPVQGEVRTRKVLAGLRINKTGKVGSDRSKAKGHGSKIGFTSKGLSNKTKGSFEIYGDKNDVPAIHTVGTTQFKKIPLKSATECENTKQMATLKGSKVKGTGGTTTNGTKFEIFTETSEENTIPTPRQLVVSARKPLSTKKEESKNPYELYDPQKVAENPNYCLCYCKNLIYMGAQEVSFEELKSQLSKYSVKTGNSAPAKKNLTFDGQVEPGMVQNCVKSHKPVSKTIEKSKDFDDEEISIKSNPLDMTTLLNQLDNNEVGKPSYESTAFFDTKKSFKPDVHFLTPELDKQNKRTKVSPQENILRVLNQTSQKISVNLDESDLGVQPFDDQECLDNLEKTLSDTQKIERNNPLNNDVLFQDVSSCPSSYSTVLTTESDIPTVKKNEMKDSKEVPIKSFTMYDANDMEVLKKLSATSGVTLDIFGVEILKNHTSITKDNPKDRMLENDILDSNSDGIKDDLMVDKLNQLNTSDLDFDSVFSYNNDMGVEKNISTKTPQLKAKPPVLDNVWAPSPTLNTKSAKDDVASMFSATLDQESFDIVLNDKDNINVKDDSFELQFQFGNKGASKNEEKNKPILQDTAASDAGFQIYADSSLKINPEKDLTWQAAQPQHLKLQECQNYTTDDVENPQNLQHNLFKTEDKSRKQVTSQLVDEDLTSNGTRYSSQEKTMCNHTMYNTVKFPGISVSTPFHPLSTLQSQTLGCNFSDITSGNFLSRTCLSDGVPDQTNLSTIQERSNEDRHNSSNEEERMNQVIYNLFDPQTKEYFVNKIMTVLQSTENFIQGYGPLPKLQAPSTELQLGPRRVRIIKTVKKGGLSASYTAVNDLDQKICLKITKSEKSDALWDFYISNEIQSRLNYFSDRSMNSNFLQHIMVCNYSDAVVVASLYSSEGTLQDLINLYVKYNCFIGEALAILYSYEILRILYDLHNLNVLHANLNPASLILGDCELTEENPLSLRCLKLQGFEKSIDLTLTDGLFRGSNIAMVYKCPEMREKKAWRSQVDHYAAAGTIHELIFHTEMNTYLDPDTKKLCLGNSIRNDWNMNLWSNLFSTLINSAGETSNYLLPLINDLAMELKKEEIIRRLDEDITEKDDLLMNDD